jgi:hypothetical protein
MICKNNYEDTPDKKEHIANDTREQEEGIIMLMLGDTKRIKPTATSLDASKYGKRTSHCLVRNERLPQVRPPWQKVAQVGTTKFIHTLPTNICSGTEKIYFFS